VFTSSLNTLTKIALTIESTTVGVNMKALRAVVGLKKLSTVRKVIDLRNHSTLKAVVVMSFQDLVAKAKIAKKEVLNIQQHLIDEEYSLPRIFGFEEFCAMYQQELDVALEENELN